MEISLIKKKLEGVKDLQEFHPHEIWEMLESAMEHIELLEEELRLLTPRAVDTLEACKKCGHYHSEFTRC